MRRTNEVQLQEEPAMRRNIILLSLSQAVLITGTSLLLTSSAIVGMALAGNKSLVTLPLALLFLAQLATTIPASLYMARVGRRFGFMTSALVGLTGAAIATIGVFIAEFENFRLPEWYIQIITYCICKCRVGISCKYSKFIHYYLSAIFYYTIIIALTYPYF